MAKVTVLGATGGLGHAVVSALLPRGHAVTAVSRSRDAMLPPHVVHRTADLTVADQVTAACEGADVVVMAVNVPYGQWDSVLEPMVDRVAEGCAAAGARLVMVDNLYAYGSPGQPITEETPEAASTRKGAIRRRIAHSLLKAHRAGRLRVTIGRCSDYYGPGGTNAVVHALGVDPALRGKTPRAMVDPDQPHTFVYLPDAGRGFATLVERDDADGQAWILPAAPAVTQRALLTMVAETAGVRSRIGRVSPAMLTVAGVFNPQLRELRELTEQWDRPYTTDARAFEARFGPIDLTPHPQAVAATIAAARQASA